MAGGLNIVEACQKFDVAPSYVYNSLAEFYGGSKKIIKPTRVYEIIAILQNGKDSLTEIAKRLRISRQRVHEVYHACLENGIWIKHKRGRSTVPGFSEEKMT